MARRGPLARAPGALRGGQEPFGERTNFRIKVSQFRKTKGAPFGVFKHPICCKISKKLRGGPFGEKKSQIAEKLKGGTLWGFSTSILSQNIKELKGSFGEKIFSRKKSRSAEKRKGGPFGLARYSMLRGKTGKTFLVQFVRPNGAIWCNIL